MSGQYRVTRGGDWGSSPGDVDVSGRARGSPGYSGAMVGVRCVVEVAGKKVAPSQSPTAASWQPLRPASQPPDTKAQLAEKPFLMRFITWPSWTNIAGLVSALAACVALYLSLRQAWRDRTILLFSLKRTWLEASEDQDPDGQIDGTPFVYVLGVTVTNKGSRPITIRTCRCVYRVVTSEASTREIKAEAGVNQKIGQGDSCAGFVRVDKSSEIIAVSVVDSTEKEWKASPRRIREFAKTHFPLQSSK